MKKILLLTTLVATILCSCGTTDYEVPTNINNSVDKSNYSFILDGITYDFPITLSDINENDWEISGLSNDKNLLSKDAYAYASINKNGCKVTLRIQNKTDTAVDISECPIVEVRCTHDPRSSDYIQFESSDGLSLGETRTKANALFHCEDSEESAYTLCRTQYATDGITEYLLGEISYFFEGEYLSQISIVYNG